MQYRKKSTITLVSLIVTAILVSCKPTTSSELLNSGDSFVSTSHETSVPTSENPLSHLFDTTIDKSYREARDFSAPAKPTHLYDTSSLSPITNFSNAEQITLDSGDFALIHGNYRLDFVKDQANKYFIRTLDIQGMSKNATGTSDRYMFENITPIRIFMNGSNDLLTAYDEVSLTNFGYEARRELLTSSGSVLSVKDAYYIANEQEFGSFNVRRSVTVISAHSNDKGFASEFLLQANQVGDYEYFVPNNVFKTLNEARTFRETQLGLPMMMLRSRAKGYTLSLARYQPVIHYEDNNYASLEINPTRKDITIVYPSKEGNRKYHTVMQGAAHVYDIVIRLETTVDYEEATASVYNAHFNLQNQRIVATDIDTVYKVVNEDYKTLLHAEEQTHPDTNKKYTSYGLPWRIHIENGEIGPYTYQAGFIGQQLPSAYNMMLYGLMNDDLTSLQNGINVIDFWVNDAEFMSIAGVPYIWYDTWANDFRSYPSFLRMQVDAMEGLLDAYRLASAHGINKESWFEALTMFGEFLAYNQNEDGSYYRTYNYDGGPFVSWDNGIEEPPGNIVQSFSKGNTPMAIRFLSKFYETTGNEIYKDAALKAGNYVYNFLYPSGFYQGGTCDNPNAIDKEAGVFAMYAYDALYTLTGEAKWLKALKQATAFTMSTVLVSSFPVRNSLNKSAKPVMAGYTDGLSFINSSAGSGVDNYIAFLYYQLFRVYIYTGEITYLKQAEFVQQNTKSIMDWDGMLNYPYRSLVAEASSVTSFTYHSADGGVWVTWSSVANAEPIAKMYTNFGNADVMNFSETDLSLLLAQLQAVGVGGKPHMTFTNTIANKL